MTSFRTFKGDALRLNAQADDAAHLAPSTEQRTFQRSSEDYVVVEVRAAAVNPSDVKAAIGLMPYAVFPRTPGRDFGGVVVDGPVELLGQDVFGSSGDLGIRRDGTHASYLVVEADAVVVKPPRLSIAQAAGIGVPFVTAMDGLTRAGLPKPGETVLIMGVNGKVGQAAAQIAAWQGARVIGVVRRPEAFAGASKTPIEIIDSSSTDVAARVRDMTSGNGADIVFNTVGEPYYEAGQQSLAKLGRMLFIASFKQPVNFDIFAFYRGRHTYIGVDSLALSSVAAGTVLRGLVPGFASGTLEPFPIAPQAAYPLTRARDAYAAVMGSARDRIIFVPER